MTRDKTPKIGDERDAAQTAWRVWWTVRNPLGLWDYSQRVEYAVTKSQAANQALAKIRRDYPHGCLTAVEEIKPGEPGAPPAL